MSSSEFVEVIFLLLFMNGTSLRKISFMRCSTPRGHCSWRSGWVYFGASTRSRPTDALLLVTSGTSCAAKYLLKGIDGFFWGSFIGRHRPQTLSEHYPRFRVRIRSPRHRGLGRVKPTCGSLLRYLGTNDWEKVDFERCTKGERRARKMC